MSQVPRLQFVYKPLCSLQMTEATLLDEDAELLPASRTPAMHMRRLLQAAAFAIQVYALV